MDGDTQDTDPRDGRHETEQEQLDRNWIELLQELRVVQTGTQLLTGFLLTVAFQQKFAKLDSFEVGLYVVLVILAAASTLLALTPVALHRALFRLRARAELVRSADRLLRGALAVVASVIVGAVLLVVDVAAGPTVGIVAAAAALIAVIALWLLYPRRVRMRE